MAREDRKIALEGEIGADDVGARRFDGERDRRQIRALVGITLVDRDLSADLIERGGQCLEATHAEGVGGMHDCPIPLAKGFDSVRGDLAGRIGVVGPEADQPRIAHFGQRGIGAAEANGLTRLQDIGRHRMSLRRPDLAYKSDDVRLRSELRESQHRARIGRLVVFGDEFNRFTECAPGFVDALERDLGAGQSILTAVRAWAGDGRHHADLDRIAASAGDGGERGRRQTRREPHVYGPSGEPHTFLPQGDCAFFLACNAQLGAVVSTQYRGIWTGELPNDRDSKTCPA